MNADMVELRGISKSFSGVQALDKVDFSLRPGEIHAVVGENGAGKSTLIKVLCGVYRPDSGTMTFKGRSLSVANIQAARALGISFVPQEIELMEHLSVAENIFLGQFPRRLGFVDWRAMRRQMGEIRDKLGGAFAGIDQDELVRNLSIASKQLVEIIKVVAFNHSVVCMDEPTSSLTMDEAERLFTLLRELKARGVSVIYVSHRLEEILALADRITVLRDGRLVVTQDAASLTREQIVSSMIGRDLHAFTRTDRSRCIGEESVLEVHDLWTADKLRGIDFHLCKGEILGWFGLIGSGRSETAKAIFGIDPCTKGDVRVHGKTTRMTSPGAAIAAHIGLVPEERHAEGLVLGLPVKNNLNLTILTSLSRFGIMNQGRERENAVACVGTLRVKTPTVETKVDDLSGGNQQKVSIAKWLCADSEILIFDEPTKGIDVGSKSEIYDLVRALADQGRSIIFISSELPEILRVSDRIQVFRDGRIAAELKNNEGLSEYDVFQYAIGEAGQK